MGYNAHKANIDAGKVEHLATPCFLKHVGD